MLLRDDFSAPFSAQQALDPARWTAYDSSYAYGRTQFGLQPSIASEGATAFARLSVRNFSGNASFPFRGTEISSPTFDLGTGKEMEARLRVTDLPSGLIAAFWAYNSRGEFGTWDFRSDEIDIEFLTKQPRNSLLLTNWNDWDPSSPIYEDGIHHAGVTASVAGLDRGQWNVYKIRWLPDRTEWFVNGALVQSLAPAHPDGPLAVRFNAWAPDSSFQAAYDPALAPAPSEGEAQNYSFDVDWVEVRTVVPTLSLSLSPASWSEGAGALASTATVRRDADLSAPLTVNIASSSASAGTPAQITLPAGAATASFPVAAIDDQIAQGDRGVSITASAGGFVSGVATATVRDNDVAGLVLDAAPLSTSEAGAQASFTVRLSSQPVAEVRLDLSSSRPAEGLSSPALLIFTPQNWSVPQAVVVAGQDDFVDDGDQGYSLALSTSNSPDGVYKQLGPVSLPVVNADDDVASIVVAAAPDLRTSEAGRGAAFSVRLASQPLAPVTIRLESSLPSEGRASPSALTFSALDWNTSQTVIAIGVDDDIADGIRPYQIATLPASSLDPLYNGLDGADVSLSNEDDDAAGFLIASAGSLETDESGRTATFTVRLSSRPLLDVTLRLSSSSGEGTVSPASLTWSAANWMLPQTVTISGADDAVDDGDKPYSIVTGAPQSGDAAYAALSAASVPDVPVLNRDNDTTGVAFTPSAGLVTSESGQSAEFFVVLQSQPLADVALRFSSGAPGEGTVAPSALVFTPSNWSLPQKVALVGVDDAIADGDQSYAVAASISSADAAYQVLAAPPIAATNRDNDLAALALSLSVGSFSEASGAQAATGTVTRNTPNGAPLTVALSSSDGTAATVPATVTIAGGRASATFVIAATDDARADGTQSSVIRAQAPGLVEASAIVTVLDDDVAPPNPMPPVPTPTPEPTPELTPVPAPTPAPSLLLSLSLSAVDENAMLQLDRPAPRGRVTRVGGSSDAVLVRLSSSDTSELRVPATILIPAGQNSVEFVLTPVDDLVADGTRQVLVAASAAGYSRAARTIAVRDNEVPTLSVSLAPARVAENGASIVTIRRNSEVGASTGALRVALSLSPARQATLPALVTIPARSSAVSVQLRAIDNALADGPRRVTITARALGWRPGLATLSIADNEAGSRLSVTGRVTTAGAAGVPRGLAVGGVTLTLLSGISGAVLDVAVSASDGSYAFRGLPPGTYRVVASREGAAFAPSTRTVTLSPSGAASNVSGLDFVATLSGQISGSVRRLNADGTLSSLPNVVVTARAGALSLSVRTDSKGLFRFERLPLGLFEITPRTASGAAFSPRSRTVRLDASNTIASGLLFTAPATSTRALIYDSAATMP